MSPREPGTQSSIRSIDATLVGRGSSATRREPTGTPQDARASRHMVGVMLAIACTLALTVTVFLQMILTLFAEARGGGGTPPAAECVEGEAEDCPENYTCVGSSCVAIQAIDSCQVGDSCEGDQASCRCLPPLTCQNQVCAADIPPAACDLPAVQKLLSQVYKTCGNIHNCPEDQLKDFIVRSEDFDQIVTAFPGTVTVHFPGSTPSIDGKRDWPSDAENKHYLEMLATPHVAAAIRDAQDVLLIGRSSASRKPDEDLRYSKARIDKVTEWLANTASGATASAALRAKIRTTILGSKKVLQPEFFIKHYANRIVAWSKIAEDNLRTKLPIFATLSPSDKKGLRGQINQVVFIIPISCTAPEAGAVP